MNAPADLILTNRAGLRIGINPLGATWTSCQLPLADGQRRELLLGSRDLAAMLAGGSYLGATVGRYAGRIAHGRFAGHALDLNQPPHCLHGGSQGFSRRLWSIVQDDRVDDGHLIRLRLLSPDGDQGFPGNLGAEACFLLSEDNSLSITFTATADAPTPCNLTSHAYFNLDGGDGDDGLAQQLQLAASRYQPVGADGIPDGKPLPVAGTGFDFRQMKPLDQDFLKDAGQQQVGGYDHSFLLDAPGMREAAAELRSADGQVRVLIFSDQPALHLYTGQYLAGTEKRDGGHYQNLAGIALESQFPPDSPSRGQAILQPGDTYRHCIRYVFRSCP